MKVQYRPARATEVDIIRDFQIAMAFETEQMKLDKATVFKGVSRVFEEPGLGQYYICEVDQEIVGSLLILKEWSDWRNAFVWWIHSLYIKPDFRNKKLFTGFYNYIQKQIGSDSNIRGVRLYVDKRNQLARRVYEKLGMTAEHYELFEWMAD